MPKGNFQCPRPCGEPLLTHSSTGSPPTPADSFGSVSCGVTASLWVLMSTKFCLCPPKLESLCLLVLWKSYNQISLALQARFPGDSQFLCRIPRLGSLMLGSEPWQQCENFFGITVLLFVGHPLMSIGFDFIITVPATLLWLLLCPWTWGIFFWWVPMFSCGRS